VTPDGAAVGAPVAGLGAELAVELRSLVSTRSVMSRFLSIATIGDPWPSALNTKE
jgi:hypothetical protein